MDLSPSQPSFLPPFNAACVVGSSPNNMPILSSIPSAARLLRLSVYQLFWREGGGPWDDPLRIRNPLRIKVLKNIWNCQDTELIWNREKENCVSYHYQETKMHTFTK